MKKVAAMLLTVLTLTACQNVADVKRDAEFAKVCKDGGGRVVYNDFGGIFCRFNEAQK